MRALKIVFFLIAGGLFLFGLLFLLGAGSPQGGGSKWVTTGIILLIVSFGCIFLATRFKGPKTETTNVTVNVDLPASSSMDALKCKSCGGALGPKDVQIVAGAPVVTCPFCHTTYQLTEEPKW